MHGKYNVKLEMLCFRRDIDEICALLGYYAALSGKSVPTFQDDVSVPSSRVNKYFLLGLLNP
jgi:hypothetical protein